MQLLDGDEDGENSILNGLATVAGNLSHISRMCDDVSGMDDRVESALIELKDITRTIATLQDSIMDDPAELERVSGRLGNIYSLENKHKVQSVNELLMLQSEYETQLAEIDGFDDEIERLEKELEHQEAVVSKLAIELSERRKATSKIFENNLKDLAVPLGMKNLQFKIEFEQVPFSPTGIDAVRFLFSFNKQQPLMPVETTASGGEISRLMLCIKSIIAKNMKLPTIIFDEVDTGVSGDVANRMGDLMKDIRGNIEGITIIHMRQVAEKGDNH